MYNLSSFTIELDRPNGVYFAGETVTGRVKFVTTNSIDARGVHVALKCIGHMQHTVTHFDGEGGSTTYFYDGKKDYEEHRFTLLGDYFDPARPVLQRTIIAAGTSELAFEIPVRAGAIGSADQFSWGTEFSMIRYSLKAFVDLGKKKEPSERPSNPSTSIYITVLPSRPLPSPDLLRAIEYRSKQPKKVPYCWLFPCCSKGNFQLEAKLGRQAFAPGETLDFHLRVNNNCSAVLDVRVHLVCSALRTTTPTILSACRMKKFKRRDWHLVHQCLLEPYKVYEVGHNFAEGNSNANREVSTVYANLNYDLKLTLPTLPPSFNGAPNLPSAGRADPLTFAYSIVFSAGTPSKYPFDIGYELSYNDCTRSSVIFPVVICAAPPSTSALQAARSINSTQPAIQLTSANRSRPLQYDANYVPQLMPGDAQLVPTVVALKPIETTIRERRSSGMFAPRVPVVAKYQPYGITYATGEAASVDTSPVVNVNTAAAGSVAVAPSAPAVNMEMTELCVASVTAAAQPDPVTSLIHNIRSSPDLRATIRIWATVSSHATTAKSLSPESLQRVLQSISNSADQVVVAKELAQLIQPCTCAHVVAALDVCSSVLTEIASCMVPNVQDKENKFFVLGLLPESDQDRVDAMFV